MPWGDKDITFEEYCVMKDESELCLLFDTYSDIKNYDKFNNSNTDIVFLLGSDSVKTTLNDILLHDCFYRITAHLPERSFTFGNIQVLDKRNTLRSLAQMFIKGFDDDQSTLNQYYFIFTINDKARYHFAFELFIDDDEKISNWVHHILKGFCSMVDDRYRRITAIEGYVKPVKTDIIYRLPDIKGIRELDVSNTKIIETFEYILPTIHQVIQG